MPWQNLREEIVMEFTALKEAAELEAFFILAASVERNRTNARLRYQECAAVRLSAAQNHQRRKMDPDYRAARNRAKRDYRARLKADPQRAAAAREARRRRCA